MQNSGELFSKFVEIMKALRDPVSGCPWDLEQNHETIKPYLVEETYEVLEAIEGKNDEELSEELGDLLLQVLLHAQIASDRGAFNINNIVTKISEKMVRRHPHVFGNVEAKTSKEVLKNWEKIKYSERTEQKAKGNSTVPTSMLEGVPKEMPALLRAQRLGQKAAKVDFDWNSVTEVWEKVLEELNELNVEIKNKSDKPELEHELGDILFALCQVARHLGISAEDSLRLCCNRFCKRFDEMERSLNRPLSSVTQEEMEKAWQLAKENTKKKA